MAFEPELLIKDAHENHVLTIAVRRHLFPLFWHSCTCPEGRLATLDALWKNSCVLTPSFYLQKSIQAWQMAAECEQGPQAAHEDPDGLAGAALKWRRGCVLLCGAAHMVTFIMLVTLCIPRIASAANHEVPSLPFKNLSAQAHIV